MAIRACYWEVNQHQYVSISSKICINIYFMDERLHVIVFKQLTSDHIIIMQDKERVNGTIAYRKLDVHEKSSNLHNRNDRGTEAQRRLTFQFLN